MKSTHRVLKSMVGLAAVCLVVGSIAVPTLHAQDASLKNPKILGVFFGAEWDAQSVDLGPKLKNLGNKYDGAPILAVLFDLTNRKTRDQAEMMASTLGLEKLWTENADKTAILYLVNAETKEALSSITPQDDFAAMCAKIEAALK